MEGENVVVKADKKVFWIIYFEDVAGQNHLINIACMRDQCHKLNPCNSNYRFILIY